MPDSIFTEDLANMYDAGVFGTSVTYTPTGGSPSTIVIIFDEDNSPASLQGRDVENTEARCRAQSSDVPNIAKNDTFVINGTTWYVAEKFVDPHDETFIELSKTAVQ